MGLTCRAVTGAVMIIGPEKGRIVTADKEAGHLAYRLVKEVRQRFETRYGSVACKDLLGLDLSIRDRFEHTRRRGLLVLVVQSSLETLWRIYKRSCQGSDSFLVRRRASVSRRKFT